MLTLSQTQSECEVQMNATLSAVPVKGAINASSKKRPEFLPLDLLLPELGSLTKPTSPSSSSSDTCNIPLPPLAHKNNKLKMNWWHTPTQEQLPTNRLCSVDDACGTQLLSNSCVYFDDQQQQQTSLSAALMMHDAKNTDGKSPTVNFDKPQLSSLNLYNELVATTYSARSRKRLQSGRSVQSSSDIGSVTNVAYNDDENDDDQNTQDSHLLVIDTTKPCAGGLLNANEEDEMRISGYRRSRARTLLCWVCICLTAGLLRLIMHWWRHWYLLATCESCPLQQAEKVLIQEDYQGKHTLYHVKTVQQLNVDKLSDSVLKAENSHERVKRTTAGASGVLTGLQPYGLDDVVTDDAHLSVHFTGAQFKSFKTMRIFRCKQLVYAWDSQLLVFKKISGLDNEVPCVHFHQQKGLTAQEQLARRRVYGPNEITVPYRDVKTLLFLEVLNPFYVFQLFSVVLWFTYNYYYYACVILLMSIFGITMSIIQTKKNQDVLRRTVLNTGCAFVVNDKGIVSEVPTQSLVPGDIIEVPATGCVMQCDAVLLSGNCILDESMLTGESVPVTKTPLPVKRGIVFDKKEHARHTLFCGTKVIQTRYIGSKKVLAYVINTGNITAKGGLIRSILYPPPVDYRFEQDSYKFIQCLALIACVGFIYTLVSKILRGTDPVKIAVESLDLITIVVPPALPAAMTVGRFYAQKRLKRKDIYCISPRSINVAGSIDCCCFDKTGTLTEDGLDMWGVVPKSPTNQFQIPLKQVERLPLDHFLFGMVTCHSITVMNGRLMGDPLDLKMFESTGWLLEDAKNIPETEKYGLIYPIVLRQPAQSKNQEETTVKADPDAKNLSTEQRQSSVDDLLANVGLSSANVTHYDHGIVREFPFTSSLQRMSVITRCLSTHQPQRFNVYCKGSPEMLQQLCQPATLPDNYTQQLSVYAKKGYRIIAMAYKSLMPKMNYTKAQRLTREEVEHDLQFLGFVIMENRLKPDTSEVISSLNSANIRTIMVTGDNILTAISVARDCGIVSAKQAVITVHAVHEDVADAELPHYNLQYTLDLGSRTCMAPNAAAATPSTIVLNGNGYGQLKAEKFTNSLDTESLNSFACSATLPNSGSWTSVKTCDTWTHNETGIDLELGNNSASAPPQVRRVTAQTTSSAWRKNYRFAMDGKTWQIVRDHFPDQLALILTRGGIFARMSPEQKQALIMELQKLDYCVAMCGDGANDCGALKVAHTGISLSETESSIASPFTSRNPTIASVPSVIREGRAALVTSFGIFKYMAAYSLVQFVSVMILYSIDSNLTDKQYLYIDLGLISIFAFFFGKTEAYAGPLAKQVPLSSLISPTPLVSLVLHLALVVAFQVVAWFHLHNQPWFEPFVHSDEDHLGCTENYTMFAISSFQYIILAFVFSKGAPYRRPLWSNWPFCLTLVVNLCIVVYLVVYPSTWISDFFQLIVPTEMSFRYLLLIFGVINFVGHVFIEAFIVEFLIFKHIQVRREQRLYTSKRRYMRVEYDLQQTYAHWPPITEFYEPQDDGSSAQLAAAAMQPTYVNLSAEQSLEIPKGAVFPGFFDGGFNVNTITTTPTATINTTTNANGVLDN